LRDQLDAAGGGRRGTSPLGRAEIRLFAGIEEHAADREIVRVQHELSI
jgi:hypothetical protein